VAFQPDYVFDGEPPIGDTWEVASGVRWLRMPLPFKLDHINLWMLEDGDGWTLVDTGINTDETRAAWDRVFERTLGGKPVKRIIVTHFHPDHVGLAGWLAARFRVPLWMPYAEWTTGRMLSFETGQTAGPVFHAFYKAAGFTGDRLAQVDRRVGRYGGNITAIPASIERIAHGDDIKIGDHVWRVIEGNGHSPEHACLHCPALGVLISGDQILPKISPNVSVWPQEPEADPLARFLHSLGRFRGLPADTLVLPSHNWPFRGLLARLDDLAQHHEDRLDDAQAACVARDNVGGATGVDVLNHLFKRELDTHQMFFALGESLAHLHHLMTLGRVSRFIDANGVYRYQAAAV
jgi:glyoxylase-like metal-dependent hydrolase (beta-lactamase superfamily II)